MPPKENKEENMNETCEKHHERTKVLEFANQRYLGALALGAVVFGALFIYLLGKMSAALETCERVDKNVIRIESKIDSMKEVSELRMGHLESRVSALAKKVGLE